MNATTRPASSGTIRRAAALAFQSRQRWHHDRAASATPAPTAPLLRAPLAGETPLSAAEVVHGTYHGLISEAPAC